MLGYTAKKSSHTRGSAVDLTLVRLFDNQQTIELDMGTEFDFMDSLSHVFAEDISSEAKANRLLLREMMIKYGFEPYEKEWWHFTLVNEPYLDEYFNFLVR